jgi:hypothetical protein
VACLLLCVLWLAKLALHGRKKREFVHPVQGALQALLPVSMLLEYPNGKPCRLPVCLLALLLHGLQAGQMINSLSTGQMPAFLWRHWPQSPSKWSGAAATPTKSPWRQCCWSA